jgi:hypothetical protein
VIRGWKTGLLTILGDVSSLRNAAAVALLRGSSAGTLAVSSVCGPLVGPCGWATGCAKERTGFPEEVLLGVLFVVLRKAAGATRSALAIGDVACGPPRLPFDMRCIAMTATRPRPKTLVL